jgi:hypothetical protein
MRVLLLACPLVLASCVSPESTRTRGGGPGADTMNRPETVRMHEGSRQYWDTPTVIDADAPPLDPAQHARQLSLQ